MSGTADNAPRVAVVTGGAHGIGAAISRALAEQGAHVVVGHARSAEAAQQLVSALQGQGHQATAQRVDVTRADEIEALAELAVALGGPHIWVNNAGASANSSETSGMRDEDRWERVMQVDVKGCWLGCRAAAPRIRAAGGGAIVNIGWNHVYDGAPDGQGAVGQIYAASKASVLALTRSFAREWAPEVRVNAVAPGWVENEWSATRSDAFRARVTQGVPLRRWGYADEIAAAVAWLASPAAAYITGQTLIVDGGEVMR